MKNIFPFRLDKRYLILLLILIIATFFRIYNVSSVPPSPSLDEVSIGYNAYSILKNGKDEYGYRFPILLRAYDDFRPGLYVYLVIPFVYLFGLSATAVRFPSVLLSIISVGATYFLVKELFYNRKTLTNTFSNADYIALLSSFLLAISPWHMYISRLGHEVNLGLFSILLAFFFFVKFIRSNLMRHLIASSLFFSLSLYSYQSQKAIVPIFITGIALIFYKKLLERKKAVIISSVLFALLSLPIFFASLSPEAFIRFKGTTAFSLENPIYKEYIQKRFEAQKRGDFLSEFFYNRRLASVSIFMRNYISHFNPFWLFQNTGREDHKIPGFGLLHIWEFPFIVLGLILFLHAKIDKKIKSLILLWFFSSAVPAAITTGAPHAMRSYTFLPIWQIFCGLGIYNLYNFVKNKSYQSMMFLLFVIILIFTIRHLSYQYFFVFPKTQSDSFQYGFLQVIPFVLENKNLYNKIVFSNQNNLYQSYMFFLFYSSYDPDLYHMQGGTKSGGFAQTHYFGKYEFRPIDWDQEKKTKKELYIGNPNDFPKDAQVIFSSTYLNGKEAIRVVQGNL